MFHNDVANNDLVTDASIEEILEDTAADQDVNDDFDDDNDIIFDTYFIDADVDQDVVTPAEVCGYINSLESQTHQLEKELEECDELLLYLPHQSKGNSQAVVLYEDLRELELAAADHGLPLEVFKQKVLSDLELENFTEEDVKREFEEFSQLQTELNKVRSAIRLGKGGELTAVVPHEDSTGAGGDNSEVSEKTIFAICNGDVSSEINESEVPAGDGTLGNTEGNFTAGPLVGFTVLSSMRDFVLEQLATIEQQHEVKVETLTKSIESFRHEERIVLQLQEERRKMLQQAHEEEEAAMLERLKENDRLVKDHHAIQNEQTAQELILVQMEIDELSKTLEEEKTRYETSRNQWLQYLEAARNQAATKIQKVYRGCRVRRKNTRTIEELKQWKELKKEEKFKLRVMEVEYEMKYQEEQIKKEKERQEKEAAEEKRKKEEEEKHRESERKRKEEEARFFEEIRKEKERKIEEQRVAEEARHRDEEATRKLEEKKRREEEMLKKEEEKRRKKEEKRKQKEEEARKREEKRKIQEEEKRRKNEEKLSKEKEKAAKDEERMCKDEQSITKQKERKIHEEELKITINEMKDVRAENIGSEENEARKDNEDETNQLIKTVNGNANAGNRLKETNESRSQIVQQAEIKDVNDIEERSTKKDFRAITRDISERTERKSETQRLSQEDNLQPNAEKSGQELHDGKVHFAPKHELFDAVSNHEKLNPSSNHEKLDFASGIREKPDISYNNEHSTMHQIPYASQSQLPPHSLSMKANLFPQNPLAKSKDLAKLESVTVQPFSVSIKNSASFQETIGGLKTRSPESHMIHQKRLNWMKSCTPWSHVSCEPWKLKLASQKTYKRPSQMNKLPPVSEAVILEKAHASSLREVSSVTLTNLPGCSLSTFGQCWSLRYLTVTNCGLMCLEGLSQCKHLLYINAENNHIEYMDLKDLGSLQVVRLAHNHLTVVSGLEGCINLRWLDLSHNRITRISGLGSLRRIHTLNMSNNQLVSSDGLEEAVTLQHLDLSHNYLQHVRSINKLCLLGDLVVSSNNLLQVPELHNQVLLQTLNLQENSIKTLEPLTQYWLPLLDSLNCSQNMLESVSDISSLILLSYLDVGHNQITDMESLLPGIRKNKRLESLILEGNPLVDEYADEYKQPVFKAVPSLRSIDHLNIQQHTTAAEETALAPATTTAAASTAATANSVESAVYSDTFVCDDFIQMCLSQKTLHTALRDEFDTQMKVLLVNQHVTGDTLCSTCFIYCDTSFKMASQHRSAHEYGDISPPKVIDQSPASIVNEPANNISVDGSKPCSETMVDRMGIVSVSANYETADRSFADNSVHSFSDKIVNSISVPNKQNHYPSSDKIKIEVNKNPDSAAVNNHVSISTNNQHSNFTDENMKSHGKVSSNTNSTVKHESRTGRSNTVNVNSIEDNTQTEKTSKHETGITFSGSDRGNSNRNNNHNDVINISLDTSSSFKEVNRFVGQENQGKSLPTNNFAASTKSTNGQLHNYGQFEQYLSGKDKFELTLQAQSSNKKGMTNVQARGGAGVNESMSVNSSTTLSGVKADVVGSQLLKNEVSDRCENLELFPHGSDGQFDMDNMAFDIDSFLDTGDLDELLDLNWRPTDIPQFPHSVHPVLGKIHTVDSHIENAQRQSKRGSDPNLPPPPLQPSQAWAHPPMAAEFKSSGPIGPFSSASPVTAPSPSSVTSVAETVARGSIRSKKEELSEEWGFKDSRTIELLVARARKMKYNSERRRKLNSLDPQQKLHLLKKLEEKYSIKTTKSPSAKVLPRKEYFKAREEEIHRQELEKQLEGTTRLHRMCEWLHTQVGDYHVSSSRINPGMNSVYTNRDSGFNKSPLIGPIQGRQPSPASDHQKLTGKTDHQARRYSSGDSHTGQSTILPPIHKSSPPSSSHKKERISFRDTPVQVSGGWGGGKKRGNVKS